MPIAAAVIPAVIGAGASVYSASQAKKAANKSLTAQNAASQQQLAAQQAALDRIVGLNQPFIQGGQASYAALLQRFGITPPASGAQAGPPPPSAQPSAPPSGAPQPATEGQSPAPQQAFPGGPRVTPAVAPQPDWSAYLQQNPDVLENAKRRVAEGSAPSLEAVAAEHYSAYGQKEGRPEPMTPGTPAQTSGPPDLMNATRPDVAPAPTFDRPGALQAPDLASYLDPSKFTADPGYQYRLNQSLDGVNAKFAARGLVRSGGAAKALQTNASDLASQEFNNWFARQLQSANAANQQYQFAQNRQDTNFNNDRAYGTSLWDYNTNRSDQNFNTDRGYQTNRYDTNNANLFDLTRIGLGAAGNVSGASQNFANNASNIYGNQGDNAAAAANARANANSGLVGGLAGAASNLFANWGGSSAPSGGSGGQTVGQAWGAATGGGFQNPYNPGSFINTPASIRF